jgi:hypothetical protein
MSENNNDARLFIMCGVPGAGKENVAFAMRNYARLLGRNTVIVDQELIMKMLFGPFENGSNINMLLVYQTIVGIARNCLKENYDVIMLGMFLVKKEREILLSTITNKEVKIIWCNSPDPTCPDGTNPLMAELFGRLDKYAARIFDEPTEEECEVVKIEDTDVFLKGENMPVIYGK